jgi:hypothetical protein
LNLPAETPISNSEHLPVPRIALPQPCVARAHDELDVEQLVWSSARARTLAAAAQSHIPADSMIRAHVAHREIHAPPRSLSRRISHFSRHLARDATAA